MFQKAVKSKCKARVAIYGPSGSGKTFSSLRIAKGLGGSIALIDTERFSASKYADRFEFDACDLTDKSIDGYLRAMEAASSYNVLVIDSLSHAWQELLEEVDRLANAKYKGNTWSAWSEGTPRQRRLISAIQNFPGHIVATIRAKTEWAQQAGDSGKSRPVRVGLAPEQGKGIEYEFDLLISLSVDHVAHIEKDRSGKFQDQIIDKPGEDFGAKLAAWLSDGAEAPKPAKPGVGMDWLAAWLPKATDADKLNKLRDKILADGNGDKGKMLDQWYAAATTQADSVERVNALESLLKLDVPLMEEKDWMKAGVRFDARRDALNVGEV